MRWFWVDRFIDFQPGRSARALKNVSLAEEHVHDHFPGHPTHPATLMIEGMAQTAGILVGQARDFREKVILAKIAKAVFDDIVTPGDQVRYEAEIQTLTDEAASTAGIVRRGDEQIGQINLLFSHVDQSRGGVKVPQENFVFTGQFERLIAPLLERRDG